MRSLLARSIENLPTNYFALVMATGICSTAAYLLTFFWIAKGLFVVAAVSLGVLGVLFSLRLGLYPRRVFSDLTDHQVGPGFFTIIAACNVFGVQLLLLLGARDLACGFWYFAIFVWLIVMYTFFVSTIVRKDKPSLEKGINGAWLIATVATQSISILGTLLTTSDPTGLKESTLFFALVMFLLGAMLYLSIITLIFYRVTFLELTMAQLAPPYWINMGAVAITTLAGATLVLHSDKHSLLATLHPFLLGFTLFFWAGGTWWIPLLLLLGIWRHGVQRYPIRYEPSYWGMVFPLGMYTACTVRLASAVKIASLMEIPRISLWVALAAWSLAFGAMIHRLWTNLRSVGEALAIREAAGVWEEIFFFRGRGMCSLAKRLQQRITERKRSHATCCSEYPHGRIRGSS